MCVLHKSILAHTIFFPWPLFRKLLSLGLKLDSFAGSDFLVLDLFTETLGSELNFLIASGTFLIPALRAAALVEGLVGSKSWRGVQGGFKGAFN